MANSTPKPAPKGAKPAAAPATAPAPAPAVQTPGALSAPRYSTWHIVGIVAGVLALVAVACLAGAAVGFGYGQAMTRATLPLTGMHGFMLQNGSMMPFGFGDEGPYGDRGLMPYGMMTPRLAGAAYLGVTYEAVDPDQASQAGLSTDEGAQVLTVIDGSPAAAAGMQAGDIILAVDGQRLLRTAMLRKLVSAHQPGDSVSLLVLRDGSERTLAVTLGQAPDTQAP
jgi:membrane-associated protease RseP (regulator of RpoE activity)